MKRILVVCSVLCLTLGTMAAQSDPVDLSKAVVVLGRPGAPFDRAADMLQQEIGARGGSKLGRAVSLPDATGPAIVVATVDALPAGMPGPPAGLEVPAKPEGYAIWVDTAARSAATVCLVGRDPRGAVFAAGRLLRLLEMAPGKAVLDSALRIASAPAYAMRGHQIGYRNTANSYDAWDVKQFEQYCRDLFVFGTNAIELIPSIDPKEKDSPHMKMTMWDMTVAMSKTIGSYGMEVWLWLPLDEDVKTVGAASEAVAKRAALFKAMPNLDGVFVPGGDPGDTAPEVLMPWLSKLAKALHESHPKAGLWVSNQGFELEANDRFFEYLQTVQPEWLAGVVFAPWAKIGVREMRQRTPKKFLVRDYPDITHCVRCQYPVPEWDRAFAHTLGREPFNPRPLAEAHIHEMAAPSTTGFISYSDGVNDDVNKIVWSTRAWDPQGDIKETLREYGRYFMGGSYADEVAEGILAFERNWQGPLLGNESVTKTFEHWRALEKRSDEKTLKTNWRFELCLLRAYYDEYVRGRLAEDTRREENAMKALANAPRAGVASAIAAARQALAEPDTNPRTAEYRARLVALGRELFDSIGMQLDVANYRASGTERGAVLAFLDQPLNNKAWLEAQFASILGEPGRGGSADAALKRVDAIVKWEEPGPGSFYDDLGNAQKQPHLVRQGTWAEDPGAVAVPMEEFNEGPDRRLSWEDQVQTLFGTPLRMKYEGLDPGARYTLRVTYAGRYRATMRLVANAGMEIHGPTPQPDPIAPMEFALPKEATAAGVLNLEWQLVAGRGCQVAEVWLLKQ